MLHISAYIIRAQVASEGDFQAMKQDIYVISDLHLGGEPGADGGPGFQMCPPSTHARLAEFLARLPAPSNGCDVRLVLAGDIVDFLAEKEFRAFTSDEDEVCQKLHQILARSVPVWDGLAGFVERGGALTLLLGNHDIELSLPKARRTLLERLGEGRVGFIYDNEALTIGPLLIEHGNRFDPWNAVAHGALRRVRSRLSRGLAGGEFPAMPGNHLVVDVMNPIKRDYSFVDLLKPEDAGVLPILAGLGAAGIKEVWQLMKHYHQSQSVDYDEEQEPTDETYIAEVPSEEEALFALAEDIAAGGDATEVSGLSLTGLRDMVGEGVRHLRRSGLHRALRSELVAKYHRQAFVLSHEQPTYLTPAGKAAKRGFRVVLYGHTHLVKRVPLGKVGVYLNSGTWADLIRVPNGVWGDDTSRAEKLLNEFVNHLEADEVEQWRRSVPTYARIELDSDEVASADVYFADSDEVVTSEEYQQRFAPGDAA
jgi:UDP-2,3-diacylglucosamine pyrophosphatase LpxH